MAEPNAAHELAASFVTLSTYLRSGDTGVSASDRLVELAVAIVPGCQWSAVTVWPHGSDPRSVASSGEVADAVDRIQFECRDGPCLTAAEEGRTVHIPDMGDEHRWRSFCEAVRSQTPVRSALSFQLAGTAPRSALNLYGREPGCFDDEALNTGALFATHAHSLLLHEDSAKKAETLETALETNRQIGVAIGILMQAHKITHDESFAMLRIASQHLNRKLRDIAADVTHTGTLPELGTP